jgi:hypothetical protein
MVPMVATKEGIFILTIKKALQAPPKSPMRREQRIAKGRFWVTLKTVPKIQAEKPRIDGKDRSISPRVTTKVIARAMIPKSGIVDMKE